MTLNLYTSNRMEVLVEYLTMVLDQEKLPPLDSEIIIVQSQGMARFLAMELAQRRGVWAGGSFPFPNAFLQDMFVRILGEDISQESWQRGSLAWRIFATLPSLLPEPGFEVLRSYCQTPEKSFQLSQQVSDLFDQYVLYRPEMIQQWSQGNDPSWQAILWRQLIKDIDEPHRAELFAMVLKRLSEGVSANLPKRIALFGLSSMAPVLIELFAALGKHIKVNVFLLNPCQVEWSQIMTHGAITKAELATGQDKETQFLENGNELLASMAHLGRDFFDLILEHDPVVNPMFVPADGPSLLAAIQNDILTLQEPKPHCLRDRSLHFSSCHNGMREVEVLFDHLLHILNDRDDVQPRDILVMAPDIGIYAPLIEAVFRGAGTSLPFSIADQSMQEQECFAGFLELLQVAKGRWRVSDIMSLLEIPVICRQFGFKVDDLDVLKEWLCEVQVHWGRDGRHRAELGLPPTSEHSFRHGLNRLLLGFAMDGDDLFMRMLPFQGGELNVDLASRFLAFYEKLLSLSTFVADEHSAEQWSRGFLDVVDQFLSPVADQEWEIDKLRTILTSLVHDTAHAGLEQNMAPEVIFVWLKKALTLDLSPYGFLSGGITFCSLLPMRAIPFQVVCLLGMNDTDFPRTQIRPAFDHVARDFRKGDRNKRNDDRYLFFEALLSARKQLYISFVGRSIIDNRQILPSVLVSELLEYVTACLAPDESTDLIVQHPIQPFNKAYFNGTLARSFSRENHGAALAHLKSTGHDQFDFRQGLNIQSESLDDPIPFADVLRFWQNPSAFFCRKTLGLSWDDREMILDDDEPFTLAGLDGYHVATLCVDSLLEGRQPELQKIRATGMLPQGMVGDMAFGRVAAQAENLVAKLQPKMTSTCENVETTITCGAYSLDVSLENLFESGQLFSRVGGKIDGRHILKAWLYHLVLQLVDTTCAKTTFLISSTEMVELQPMDNSEELLITILDLYSKGLGEPLPFFAKSSWVYSRIAAEKNVFAALDKAQKEFNPEFRQFPPESEDPAISRCFGDSYELGSGFEAIARDLFSELFGVAEFDLE